MTGVRRTAPPCRLKDGGQLGIEFTVPVGGNVDHAWRAAFHAEIVSEAQGSGLPDYKAFTRSLNVTGNAITFHMAPDEQGHLGAHLDVIDASIRAANSTVSEEEERAQAAVLKAQHDMEERDRRFDAELQAWSAAHPADA